MIEFKQIIGRGTRLFDGKEYFTIYDFVDAYHHFADPEWDGEPVDETTEEPPRGPEGDGPGGDPQVCAACGQYPCVCNLEPAKKKLKIKLRDGKRA